MEIFEKSNNALGSINVVYENPVSGEVANEKGLSHMLEHMITDNLVDLEEKFDQHGLMTNAYTSDHEVVFYLHGLSSEVDRFREEFVRRITEYRPTEEHFHKQHPIILQEYDDAYANPRHAFWMNLMSMEHGFVGPIGVRSAIEKADVDTLRNLHSRVFAAPTKIIAVGESPLGMPSITYGNVMRHNGLDVRHTDGSAKTTESSVSISCMSPVLSCAGSYHAKMLGLMLGYGLPSPLYQELREKRGLCYAVSAYTSSVNGGVIFSIDSSVKGENVAAARATIQEVLRSGRDILTRDRFNLILENRKISKTVSEQYNSTNGYQKYLDSHRPEVNLLCNLDTITYEDTLDYFDRYLNPANHDWQFFDQISYRQAQE